MMTGRVIGGNAEAGVMVRTPAGGSVMANWIVFVPSAPLALASVIACRNEPAPVSLVVVTVKVAARAACAASKPRSSPRIKILVFIDFFLITDQDHADKTAENPHGINLLHEAHAVVAGGVGGCPDMETIGRNDSEAAEDDRGRQVNEVMDKAAVR